MTDTYTRTIRVPVETLTATKAGKLARAMKDYRRARQETLAYFAGEGDPMDFAYDERERLRKRLSRHDDIDLPARLLYPAITTVEQNYAEYVKGQFDNQPEATQADTLGLEGQQTRLFHDAGTYYLDIPTGRGSVLCPLHTSDDDWHQRRLPAPTAVDTEGRTRCGAPFAEIEADSLPDNTVKLSSSTLTRTGERSFVANLVFQHEKRIQQPGDGTFVVGVDRGRNQLVTAAVYDTDRDHVVGWLHVGGDEIEHYMDRFAERIAEFQQAGVWEQMEAARKRRFRYKRQQDYRAARRVVELARERFGVRIAVEDLSSMGRLGGYNAESRRFSEWSYGRQRDAIAQKAEPYDIPVVAVEPRNTSQICSRCGSEDTRRSGVHFECRECGYDQHADANAAVNIAKRAAGVGPLAADDSATVTVSP
jgi:IS605 OrfB family transposase